MVECTCISSHIVLERAIGQAAYNVGVHHSPGQLDLPRGAIFSAPDVLKHLCADNLQQEQGGVLGCYNRQQGLGSAGRGPA